MFEHFAINKKIIFLIFSFLCVLALIALSIYKLILDSEGTKGSYALLLIGLTIYLFYIFKIYRDEYTNAKLDKEEGVEEGLFEFLDFKIFDKYSSLNHNNPTYPVSMATFRFLGKKKFVSLSGDYSKIKLVKGNKYKVSFYSHSGILVEINEA